MRRAMAWMSAAFNHHPSQDLKVVGVTGTNGKTTTAHLVKAILDHAGVPCGLIGTLTGTRTTPESPHLQASLRGMVDDGLGAVAIEVSSHALTQHRPLGTEFDVGVFTNLSADHLDYHGSMDEYFDAKALLFRTGMVSAAVVNDSDDYGRRLLAELDVPTTPYSSDQASGIELGLAGSTFTWREQGVSLALPGLFNLENAIAAAEATRFLGLDDGAIAAGLSAAGQVAGRFEVVAGPSGATVIVDYAHSPAGLERLLESVRAIDPTATVCVVFGAGGDRDREKRPLMGAAASRQRRPHHLDVGQPEIRRSQATSSRKSGVVSMTNRRLRSSRIVAGRLPRLLLSTVRVTSLLSRARATRPRKPSPTPSSNSTIATSCAN